MSEVQQTHDGPLRFAVNVGDDGRLEITGTPVGTASGKVISWSDNYRLEGDQVISPVVNKGQPVRLALRGGELTLTIDETLTLQLRRE